MAHLYYVCEDYLLAMRDENVGSRDQAPMGLVFFNLIEAPFIYSIN